MEIGAIEIRVLGCLIEKQRTTPDTYPLTLNALRLACNQATNRDPVVDYSEPEIRTAIAALSRRRWARTASSQSSRAAKYRHLLDSELGLAGDEISVLCVLMLRGTQTPGELKQRTERLHAFESLDSVHETLDALIERELVVRLPRRPGQKEERYEQRISADSEGQEAEADDAASLTIDDDDDRLDRLERELADLRTELAQLREMVGG